jgi:sigma-E factor negative regulatory protein RseC
MIETSARVISVGNGTALVEPSAQTGCGSCRSHSTCGVSGLGKYFSANRNAIAVRCDAGVSAGDELQLSMSEGDFLKAGLLVYLLPSVLTIIGAGLAASLDFGDAGAVLGAVSGFAGGMLIVKLLAWKPHMTVCQVQVSLNSLFNEGETP